MKIIFFGSSSFSIPVLKALINSHHKVSHVVTVPPQKKGRGLKPAPSEVKAFAEAKQLSVSEPEKLSEEYVGTILKTLAPDFFVAASYGKLIPKSIFTIPKFDSLNVHPSLLPKYRGASPIQASILAVEKTTGVSIFSITEKLDSGDLYAQASTHIHDEETALELSARLSDLGAKLLLEVLDQFEKGVARKIPQDESQATYAAKIHKESGRINWSQDAQKIHNQVRAYFPWPSAFTFFRGKRLKILETRVPSGIGFINPSPLPSPLRGEGRLWGHSDESSLPGTIRNIGNERFDVMAGSGVIVLFRVQEEGARAMSAAEYARGKHIQAGERFDSKS